MKEVLGREIYVLDMLFEEIFEKLRRGSLYWQWVKAILTSRNYLSTHSIVFIDF